MAEDKQSAPAPPAKQSGAPFKPADAILGIGFGIILIAGIFYLFGLNPLDLFNYDVGTCDAKEGKTLCGFCASNLRCQYCTEGYACEFANPEDTCSALTCSSGGGSTFVNPCQSGYCYSGGQCCPKSTPYYCRGGCRSYNDAVSSGCTSNTAFCN